MTRALLAFVALTQLACAHTITVESETPGAKVIVDGQDVGVPPPGGAKVDVRRGVGSIPYEVHRADGTVGFGAIERTETAWWIVGLAGAGALCCAPSLAMAGFVAANPVIFAAPLVLLTGDIGIATRACVAPAWLTIPAMVGCGTVGLAPLGFAFVAEEPPAVVTLPAEQPAAQLEKPVAMRF